jgi:hypothetical protein
VDGIQSNFQVEVFCDILITILTGIQTFLENPEETSKYAKESNGSTQPSMAILLRIVLSIEARNRIQRVVMA